MVRLKRRRNEKKKKKKTPNDCFFNGNIKNNNKLKKKKKKKPPLDCLFIKLFLLGTESSSTDLDWFHVCMISVSQACDQSQQTETIREIALYYFESNMEELKLDKSLRL